ncbi:Peroxisomal coenzyme A diphosphatase NUDT7 [Bagarius yarrelli]|uniref:Peroxisomal coenzyme A diphosphatase NUDT7 n=1 Tax=Bagarius yarrelli TaxID=175774 RepID=A0A556TNI1_BAGYA|nr:Peroxisomal coenzyme A diphosphatase NUDT7 [Bagarius yarrelli]
MDVKAEVISSLRKHDVGDEFSHLSSFPKASVLIPLFLREGRVHVLLTVRSAELKHNPGEVCFPGGKTDPHDQNEVGTALREALEEVGLPTDEVEVVCRFCPLINKRGLLVTPVVAFISDSFHPSANPGEVSEVFSVPVEFFLKGTNHSAFPVPGTKNFLHSFSYTDPVTGKSHHIWGLTAFLLILLAVLAFEQKPEFEFAFDLKNPTASFQQLVQSWLSKL